MKWRAARLKKEAEAILAGLAIAVGAGSLVGLAVAIIEPWLGLIFGLGMFGLSVDILFGKLPR
jgi:ABC-type microcin C transport system permease subunit YejE